MKGVHIHQFADASQIACSTVTIAVIEHETNKVMGLLTSRSRIAKKHFYCPVRVDKWSHGCKHGKESM